MTWTAHRVFATLALALTVGAPQSIFAQPAIGGAAVRAFGAREWREAVATVGALPTCDTGSGISSENGVLRYVVAEQALYRCSGGAWAVALAAGGGSGDITAVGDCATGACFSSVTARHAFLGPVGGGTAAFRALVEADISDLAHTVDTDSNCLDAGVTCPFAGSASEGGPATSALSVSADSVALTTDTTGNYVASITSGAGITGGDGGSEGAALTIAATLGTEIEVSELADGAAGQLITWDAAGAPATVATGGAGEVLTSNGAGAAPTFQAAAGGGIGGSTGATNDAILRADGIGGSTVQSSGAVVTDGGQVQLIDQLLVYKGNLGNSDNLRIISAAARSDVWSSSGQGSGLLLGSDAGPVTLYAQGNVLLQVGSGTNGLGVTSAATTNYRPIHHQTPETNAPATCAIGDSYVDSSGAYCACVSTNTWENTVSVGSCT